MARRKRRRARKKGRAKRIARVQQVMADKAAEEMRLEAIWEDLQDVRHLAVTGRMRTSKPNIQQVPRSAKP